MREWKNFNEDFINRYHGDIETYRKLYNGEHAELFPRAERLLSTGEITSVMENGKVKGLNVSTPYLMLNICKMIIDIPTLLITQSLGSIKTNYPLEKHLADETTEQEAEMIEGTKNGIAVNKDVFDLQQETIDQITDNSRLNHRKNVTQLQIDGGLVSVPAIINGQIKILIKERNVYYPHDDGFGYDLVYRLEQTEEEKKNGVNAVHVYTERENMDSVETLHRLYVGRSSSDLVEIKDENIVRKRLGINNLKATYHGRKRSFIEYIAYNPTFSDEYGVSALAGMEGRQDEVNWTLTRTAQTFERNGKPRISVTKEVMMTLQDIAQERYGDPTKIDHRDLEVTEMNERGESIKVHQIDIQNIGDMSYVKDIVRGMLSETQTSESAFDFVRRESARAQSGIAKFYDFMISIMKAKSIRNEYVDFLKNSYENALWFANNQNKNVIIEKPNIAVHSMLSQATREVADENIAKYTNGVQSLDETVRNINPDKTDEWIVAEIERIQDDKSTTDSMSLTPFNNTTLQDFMNNRDDNGTPVENHENL